MVKELWIRSWGRLWIRSQAVLLGLVGAFILGGLLSLVVVVWL
jgi:hypothetical protein